MDRIRQYFRQSSTSGNNRRQRATPAVSVSTTPAVSVSTTHSASQHIIPSEDLEQTVRDLEEFSRQISDTCDTNELAQRLERITETVRNAGRHAQENSENSEPRDSEIHSRENYKIDNLVRLKRFIVIGSERGLYHCSDTFDPDEDIEKTIIDNVKCVLALINDNREQEVFDTITKFNHRASKADSLLMVLMTCVMCGNRKVEKAAYALVPKICNIPTKLFYFLDICQIIINRRRTETDYIPPTPQIDGSKKNRKRKHQSVPDEPDGPPRKKVNTKAKKSSSWGRMRRSAIAKFYTDENKDHNRLLYLMSKYKQRHNWTHRQALGLCHPKFKGADKEAKDFVLTYVTRGYTRIQKKKEQLEKDRIMVSTYVNQVIGNIDVLEQVKRLRPDNNGDLEKMIVLIKKYSLRLDVEEQDYNIKEDSKEYRKQSFHLVREHIPNGFYDKPEIWEALLHREMPITCLLCNLAKMSNLGLFDKSKDKTENIKIVVETFKNVDCIMRSRIHPVKILIAMMAYNSNSNQYKCDYNKKSKKREKDMERRSYAWVVQKNILEALNDAFHHSFMQPKRKLELKTGKRFMITIDVSDSMEYEACRGCSQLTPAQAAAAMALILWEVEDFCEIYAFGAREKDLLYLNGRLKKNMKVYDAVKVLKTPHSTVDSAKPMIQALKDRMEVDVFIIFTDSETWKGRFTPARALRKYREEMNLPDAKLVVCAMQANEFTIADSNDPNMLDICGFDSNVPFIISNFAKNSFTGEL